MAADHPAPRTCGFRTLNGEPCTRRPLPGTARCRLHDGRALREAERRLSKLTVPAVKRLGELLQDDSGQVALKAAAMILDRTAGPVPRPIISGDLAGVPSVQIGFALGGLVHTPLPPVAAPPGLPAIDATPAPDPEDEPA